MDTLRPRASRTSDGRVIAGVAAGLAEHLGQPVFRVRLAFAIGSLFHGAGAGIYLGLWVFLPLDEDDADASPKRSTLWGLTAHSRRSEAIQTLAVILIAFGIFVLMQASGRGINPAVLGPLLVAGVGIVLVWRQFDDQRRRNAAVSQRSAGAVVRIVIGTFLVGVAAVYLLSSGRNLSESVSLLATVAVALFGMALVLGPWMLRLISDLAAERRERIRTQERADVAAHLHDSVLQTLALLQKNAEDAGAVATLARRQERELREWLYGSSSRDAAGDQTLSAALKAAAAEVEHDHHVAIEVVTVSDVPVDERVSQLLLAAREAMVNAAKHSGADRIDVYAEVAAEKAEVFVRDRGRGFDTARIPEHRLGIRGSIIDRMRRHNGDAEISSGISEGTSIHMVLPLGKPAAA